MIPAMNDEEFFLFNELLEKRFGIVFADHKREMLQSKLHAALTLAGHLTYQEYYLSLQFNSNGGEALGSLAEAVTNNETYFFRETGQFDSFFDEALEGLKAECAVEGRLRILCAGCASGEEPYTLNIYAKENQYRLWAHEVQLDAFDLDESKIRHARQGIYGPNSFRGVTEEQIAKYFTPAQPQGHYALKPLFQKGVSFRHGNIFHPSSYGLQGAYDALFCRNVVIYFSEAALHKAAEFFANGLRPGGLLFMGHSESLLGVTPRLEPTRLGQGIVYRKVQ